MTDNTALLTTKMRQAIASVQSCQAIGRVVEARGTLLTVSGLSLAIGEMCNLQLNDNTALQAEVVGITASGALLQPIGSLQGVACDTPVRATGVQPMIAVGDNLIGRVLDANGKPVDEGGALSNLTQRPLYTAPPDPLRRTKIQTVFSSGIKVVDNFLTVGVGQRVGIFAAAGAGKSTLMGMLAQSEQADVVVIALIGERGREVKEFIEHNLKSHMQRSVLVVATSDKPALERARALTTATCIAEFFRDQGKQVLLLADSITRYARALRDVGLATGEPPARRGFPPSVFSQLPQILERAGNNDTGAITAFYTVLMEDEDTVDPVAEEVRSILDGHITLSRKLASEHQYPAIDVLSSVSRVMSLLVTPEHAQLAARGRRLLSRYQDIELLLQMGEFQEGYDMEADQAKAVVPVLRQHLAQRSDDFTSFDQALCSLREVLNNV